MAASFDPDSFKTELRSGWDNTAAGWSRWWPTFEAAAQSLNDRLVALAHVGPGSRVLDLATGSGEPALTAARAGASVLGIDQSPAMLELARQRAGDAGLGGASFQLGDVETLTLPPASFDAILCRWGLMFFTDLDGTLQRLRLLLRPGGYIAAAVWGLPERTPLIRLRQEVLAREIGVVPIPGAPSSFSLGPEGTSHAALAAAGFMDVVEERVWIDFDFESANDYARFQKDVMSARIPELEALTPARRDEVWRAVTEAAERYAGEGGRVRMTNECVCVSGRTPDRA